MSAIKSLSIAVSMVFLLGAAAEAGCSRKGVSGADQMINPASGINQTLLDRAILAEVNYERCRAGLPALRGESRLRQIAKGHSEWMAKARTLSHKSTVSGRSTLKARIKKTGLKPRAGSENIGMLHRFQLDRQSFLIRDHASCKFATHGGQPIPPHSYKSLARNIVTEWMNSKGHRRNILDRKVSMMGSAAAHDPRAEFCGTFYITQNFAG